MRNQRYHQSDSAISEHARKLYDPALKNGLITAKDADLIREFINDLAGSVSPVREYKLTNLLIRGREFFPPYETITTSAAQEGVRNLLTAVKPDGTPRFKANTLNDKVRVMKRFFIWMIENNYGEGLNEKKIRKIVVPPPDRMTKTADNLLSKEEVEKIIRQATSSRDRALISVLYEGGLRGRELADLTWNDLKFTPWNVVLNTAGKTGKPRYLPLYMSRPYLAAWKNDYPADLTPDSYVFITLNKSGRTGEHLPMSYNNVTFRLKKLAAEAGIKKQVSTHLFRHSRITHLINEKVPESFIKKMMWGNLETGMLSTYGHLTNADLDDCIADMYGIQIHDTAEQEKKEKILHPRQCNECGTVNEPTANYCAVCGQPLTAEATGGTEKKRDELQKLLEDDATVLEVLTFIKSVKAAKNAGNAPTDEAGQLTAGSLQ